MFRVNGILINNFNIRFENIDINLERIGFGVEIREGMVVVREKLIG
jgi:hypothetical protein